MKKGKKDCNKGHPLVKISGFAEGSFTCNLCFQNHANSEGKMSCLGCDYDICANCGKFEKGLKDEENFGVVCARGHQMEFTQSGAGLKGYEEPNQFNCDKCGLDKPLSDGRWCCFPCTYDICKECLPKPSGSALEFRKKHGLGLTKMQALAQQAAEIESGNMEDV